MSKQEDDAFAEWQAKLAAEFTDPEEKAAWETLTGKKPDMIREQFFRGAMRKDEFNRNLNATKKEQQAAAEARAAAEAVVQQSHDWYAMSRPEYDKAVKKAEVAYNMLREHGLLEGAGGAVAPQGGGRQVMEQSNGELEVLKAQLASINQGLPNYMRDFAQVSNVIYKQGFNVDPTAVMDFSAQRGVTLTQALDELTREERASRQEADIQKRITEGVEAETRKRMASLPTPDFVRGGPRASFTDQLKEMDALADSNTRRDAGIALLREHLTSPK